MLENEKDDFNQYMFAYRQFSPTGLHFEMIEIIKTKEKVFFGIKRYIGQLGG